MIEKTRCCVAGAHAEIAAAKCGHSGSPMHEDDLIGNEMPVQLDLGAGRGVFIPHHEVRRPTIPAIDLENEGALPSGSAHAALSFVELQYEPRARLDGGPET